MPVILKGGRVIDPRSGLDAVTDVTIDGGRISHVGSAAPSIGAVVQDASGCLVLPGLVDFHTHVFFGGTSLAVQAEPFAARSGVVTFVDAGTAGATNFQGFRDYVIRPSRLRILAYLNISYAGIFAWTPTLMFGECTDLRLLDPFECVRVARENPGHIVGIKVRLGRYASGSRGIAPLEIALQVAEEARLPVMAHIDYPPPGYREILSRLRPGDVLTHCYKPFPNSLLSVDGAVRDGVLEARERGVIFDIGHGTASFGLRSARGLLEAGFPPDIISSDIHSMSAGSGEFDLLTVMSKFLALGMDVKEIVAAVTSAPARALGRSDFGALAPGMPADVTLLRIEEGRFTYPDSVGENIEAKSRFVLERLYVGGEPWAKPAQPDMEHSRGSL